MIKPQYSIYLDDVKIGASQLENADAPMGVVFGKIHFDGIKSGYDFFVDFCLKEGIAYIDDARERIIMINDFLRLRVLNSKGVEIRGLGNQVSGSDADFFEIYLLGIPYPFYEEEFEEHVKAYNNQAY